MSEEKKDIYVSEEIDKSDLKVPADPIPYEEFERFLYSLKEVSKEYPERNTLLFLLQTGTGYRLQDLTDLTVGKIKEALINEKIIIQEKKQMKAWITYKKNNPTSNRPRPPKRTVDIEKNSDLEKMLKVYVKGKKSSEWAFPSEGPYGYITPKAFSRILRKAGENIGLENISGHSGRKSYATWLLEDTDNIVFVSKQMGHKSTTTTMLYISSVKKDRKKASRLMSRRLSFF